MLPPVNPPRHLSEAISTKLGPYTSLHSRSVQAGAMLKSTRQIPAAIANFAPDSDVFLWIKSDQSRTTAVGHDDGDGRDRFHGRNRARIGPGDDNVPAEPDQIRSKREQRFQLAVREAVLDGDILASDCFREAIERYPIR